MAVLEDYLREWGQYSFKKRPLTEADLLIFNSLGYLPFDQILRRCPQLIDTDGASRFEDVFRQFSAHHQDFEHHNPLMINPPRVRNWTVAAHSPRYRNLRLMHFVTERHNNEQMTEQFSAYTVDLSPDNGHLIVYKGTNQNLAGWYENFLLATKGVMPSHLSAQKYCNQILKYTSGPVMLTGYSKGGSLAIYAAAFCDQPERLSHIITFDSPGFQADFLETKEYQAIEQKINRYVPEDSIVGMILKHTREPIVIKSHLFSVIQHFLFLWEIDLETGDLQRDIDNDFHIHTINQIAERWTEHYSAEDLAFYLDLIYSILQSLGIENVYQIFEQWTNIVKDFQQKLGEETPETQEKFASMSSEFMAIARSTVRDNIGKPFEGWANYKEQLKDLFKKK